MVIKAKDVVFATPSVEILFVIDRSIRLLPNQNAYFYGENPDAAPVNQMGGGGGGVGGVQSSFNLLKPFVMNDKGRTCDVRGVPVDSHFKILILTDLVSPAGANLPKQPLDSHDVIARTVLANASVFYAIYDKVGNNSDPHVRNNNVIPAGKNKLEWLVTADSFDPTEVSAVGVSALQAYSALSIPVYSAGMIVITATMPVSPIIANRSFIFFIMGGGSMYFGTTDGSSYVNGESVYGSYQIPPSTPLPITITYSVGALQLIQPPNPSGSVTNVLGNAMPTTLTVSSSSPSLPSTTFTARGGNVATPFSVNPASVDQFTGTDSNIVTAIINTNVFGLSTPSADQFGQTGGLLIILFT